MKNKNESSNHIVKNALSMAWPAMMESFFVAVVGLVDSKMVSNLGKASVAAVGITTHPKFLGLAIFFALNTSISAIIARRNGEKKKKEANEVLLLALVCILFATVVVSTICVFFANDIISLCGSNEATHDSAVIYYQIIMGGMLFNVISMGINSALRGCGKTKIALRTNLTSNIVNVVFNYLLIDGHYGFPALGIKGAAIATVLGTVVACIMSIISLCNASNFVSIPYMITNHIRLKLTPLKQIIKLGYALFIEQVLMRFGFLATSVMAARLSTDVMAAHQIGMNLLSVTFSFGDGMQVAAVALIGRSLGERNPEKAKQYGKTCQKIGLCIAFVLGFIYLFFGRFIFQCFFDEALIIDYGVIITRLVSVIVLFQISQVVFMGSLRGAGDTAYTAMASTISVSIIRTLTSYFFCYTLNFGIAGIWLGILCDQIARFLFGSIRFKLGKWTKIHI